VLFAGTLEENIALAGNHSSDARFQQALWVSGLEDEFKSGKLSLGMKLEERGANLSGGQRQKVALARTLAQSAKIILLDEPSLGFDPDTERQFAERLAHWLSPDLTLIMTTHSATMLSLIQRVIALDQGKVIADGPKEKLLNTG
jgi:ABC-type bacteriocin/lantibiotic exporter with double-glycine peptidase domain